jgi:hypothetical protein
MTLYTVRFTSKNGMPRHRVVTAKSEDEAEAKFAAIFTRRGQGVPRVMAVEVWPEPQVRTVVLTVGGG